jgi:hypothetical protein
MRRLAAIRYVTPLREGGSLPAVCETDDGRLFVVKLRGAGQGTRALIAELVAGELARAFGLAVPEIALVEVDAQLAASERDPEIQDLLRASAGINLGLEFLPGALMFDPAADGPVEAGLAGRVVALDAYVMNVDRTPRNPNLLVHRGAIWLIDHGASLIWHHAWDGGLAGADRTVRVLRDHVLLPFAAREPERWAGELGARLPDDTLAAAVAALPDDWLVAPATRERYLAYLRARRDAAASYLPALWEP